MKTTKQSSLEWFFNTPSSANFPQVFMSPALSALQSNFVQLADSVFAAATSVHDDVSAASILYELSKRAGALAQEFKSSFNSQMAQELVSTTRAIGLALKRTRSGTFQVERANRDFKEVLSCLIVYARESSDHTFKQSVIDLVRSFEAAFQ
ncbi:hypothetical protein [Herbaspirillum camelliae]|uniref:hypothetical protein n=1 Tax=Herbaspirillum camelliae TaxID=1892903 RepID=UPI000949EF95|nr:hypothetical protein [Herbaspirillum camelliae]